MIQLNSNSLILPSKMYEPIIGFDPDLYKLLIKNRDTRDTPSISYTLNENSYTTNGISDYDLPEIDKEYIISYTLNPSKDYLKPYSGSSKIFKNSIYCRDFIYGEGYTSQNIVGYVGKLSNITIPDKHNLVYTTHANITEFPNVDGYITIKTGEYLDSFWIKDSNIKEINIGSPNFSPIEKQFSDLVNLKTIRKLNSWYQIPNECFYNCSSLSLDDNFFKETTSFGNMSLYNTGISTIKFNGISTEGSGLSNAVVFTYKSTINGYNEKTLYNNNSADNVTCFVNLKESEWSSNQASNDAYVVPRGINKSGSTKTMYGCPVPDQCCLAECSDINIIGFKFKTLSNFGDTADIIGYGVHIPQGITTKNNEDYSKIVNGKKFFIVNSDFYFNDNSEGALVDNSIIEISAFDKNGYKSTVIRKRWDGDDKPTFKTEIAFFTTENNTTLTLNGEVFETNVPSGRLYIYGDMFNIPKFTFRITDKNYNSKWDFLIEEIGNLNDTSDKNIKWIDVSDYITYEAIMNSGVSWPTFYDSIEDFYLLVYNTSIDDITMTGNPAGTSADWYTLSTAKTSFTY